MEYYSAHLPVDLPLKYEKLSEEIRRNDRFKRDDFVTKFQITPKVGICGNLLDVSTAVDVILDNLIKSVLDKYPNDNYYVGAYLEQRELGISSYVAPKRIREFNAGDISSKIKKVHQINSVILTDNEFKLELTVTEIV